MKKIIFTIFISFLLTTLSCSKKPTGEHSQKVKLRFLTEEFYPLSFIDENGKPAGMAVDLLNEAGKILKIKPEIKVQLWDKSYKEALQQPNIFLFSTTKTKIREDKFYWLKPYLKKFKANLYKKRGSNISIDKLEDAKKYKIATIKEYFSEQIIINDGFKNINRYDTPEKAMKALIEGKVDLAIFSDFRAHILITKIGYSISDIIPVYTSKSLEMYIAVSKKTSQKVIDEWQNALAILAKNKTYYKLYEKWFLRSTIFK